MRIGIIAGIQNTKLNPEDFALTPYLFLVKPMPNEYKTFGIGICWGWIAFFIGISFSLDNDINRFIWMNELESKNL